MNKVLLDTSIIIEYIRNGETKANDQLFLRSTISQITYTELIYGFYKSKKIRELIKIDEFIKDFDIDVITINNQVSHKFCELKTTLENKDTKLADFDLIIASTAIVNNLSLYTTNTKHFQRIKGLELIK